MCLFCSGLTSSIIARNAVPTLHADHVVSFSVSTFTSYSKVQNRSVIHVGVSSFDSHFADKIFLQIYPTGV